MNYIRFRFVALLCILLHSLSSFAYDAEVDGIYYNFSGTTATVTYYSELWGPYDHENNWAYSNSITIPESVTYNGKTYSVTSIGSGAFQCCSNLYSVTIPSSVTSIENGAFRECTSLSSLTIPLSVTSIGERVFELCSRLTSIYVDSRNKIYDSRDNCNAIIETASNTLIAGCNKTIIPNSVTSIGNYAFYYFSGLTSVAIPSSVTSIGDEAFWCCSGLTSMTIPSSVTNIGERAFYGCSGLTSVTIPSSVRSIGRYAFQHCRGLTSINVDSRNKSYDSRDNCNAIIETASNTLIAGCNNTSIPTSVTSIGSSAFYGCSGLTSVTIPSGVTSIGSSAFEGCSGLTSVTIPSGVTSIGNSAFGKCI